MLLRGRASWLSVAAQPAEADALLPDVMVCVSAGFFAFHLWALVHHRCNREACMNLVLALGPNNDAACLKNDGLTELIICWVHNLDCQQACEPSLQAAQR